MEVDFKTLADVIFKNKNKYKNITTEEKEKNFFILNRKFAYQYLNKSMFFNKKDIDRALAMDIWFNSFNNTRGIPSWYWQSSIKKTKNTKKKIPDKDFKLLTEKLDLNEKDVNFLLKYYDDDVKSTIKRLKKFNSNV